jgi:hypothetical protein
MQGGGAGGGGGGDNRDEKCFNCGMHGHLSRDCPDRNKGNPSAPLVRAAREDAPAEWRAPATAGRREAADGVKRGRGGHMCPQRFMENGSSRTEATGCQPVRRGRRDARGGGRAGATHDARKQGACHTRTRVASARAASRASRSCGWR